MSLKKIKGKKKHNMLSLITLKMCKNAVRNFKPAEFLPNLIRFDVCVGHGLPSSFDKPEADTPRVLDLFLLMLGCCD